MVRQLVRDIIMFIDTWAGNVTLLLRRQTIVEESRSEKSEDVKIAEVCRLLLGDFLANLSRLLEEETDAGQPCLLPCFEDFRQLAIKVRRPGLGVQFILFTRKIQVFGTYGPCVNAIANGWCCSCREYGTKGFDGEWMEGGGF